MESSISLAHQISAKLQTLRQHTTRVIGILNDFTHISHSSSRDEQESPSKPEPTRLLITPDTYASHLAQSKNASTIKPDFSADDLDGFDDDEDELHLSQVNSENSDQGAFGLNVHFQGQQYPTQQKPAQTDSNNPTLISLTMIEQWVSMLRSAPPATLNKFAPLVQQLQQSIYQPPQQRQTGTISAEDDDMAEFDGAMTVRVPVDANNRPDDLDMMDSESDGESDDFFKPTQAVGVIEDGMVMTADGMKVPVGVSFQNGKWITVGKTDDTVDDLDAIDDFDTPSEKHNTPHRTPTKPVLTKTYESDDLEEVMDIAELGLDGITLKASPNTDKRTTRMNLQTLSKHEMEALVNKAIDDDSVVRSGLGLIKGIRNDDTSGGDAFMISAHHQGDFPDTIDDLEVSSCTSSSSNGSSGSGNGNGKATQDTTTLTLPPTKPLKSVVLEDLSDHLEDTHTTEAKDVVNSSIPSFKQHTKSSRVEYPEDLDHLDNNSEEHSRNSNSDNRSRFTSRSASHTPSSASTTMPTTPDSATRSSLQLDPFELDELDNFGDDDDMDHDSFTHQARLQPIAAQHAGTSLKEGSQRELHEFVLPESLMQSFRATEQHHHDAFNTPAFMEKSTKPSNTPKTAIALYPALFSINFVQEQNIKYQWTKFIATMFDKQQHL